MAVGRTSTNTRAGITRLLNGLTLGFLLLLALLMGWRRIWSYDIGFYFANRAEDMPTPPRDG